MQGPIMQTEAHGSARVIAVRPETNPAITGSEDTANEDLPAIPNVTSGVETAPVTSITPAGQSE